jgi:hypothetical protein
MNWQKAQARADELAARLQKRTVALEQERRVAARPPVVVGGALIVPAGLLARLHGERQAEPTLYARETKRVERAAMDAVMAVERGLGYEPRDVGHENRGYDVESGTGTGTLRFIEVKGRIRGADAVTLTKNEILTSLNKPDDWILALVEVPPVEEFAGGDAFEVREPRPEYGRGDGCVVRYLRRPFTREPDFDVTSVNYKWRELWARAVEPSDEAAEPGAPETDAVSSELLNTHNIRREP